MKAPATQTSANRHEFREAWLRAATAELRPYFASAGYPLPDNIRFAIAFTSTGRKGTRRSESWHSSSSADSNYEIFIRADIAEPVEVLALLVKELVHTALPDGSGHGRLFREAAMKIGLLPPMRKAEPAPHLIQRLEQLAVALGPLPHDRLDLNTDPLTAVNPTVRTVALNGQKQQRNRSLKAVCSAEDCSFLVRVTARNVREVGLPHCPKHGAMVIDLPEDELTEANAHGLDNVPANTLLSSGTPPLAA